MADLNAGCAIYRSNQAKLEKLRTYYAHRSSTMPDDVSSGIATDIDNNTRELAAVRARLLKAGADDNSLGWAPIVWGLILAVPLAAGALGYGVYEWSQAEQLREETRQAQLDNDIRLAQMGWTPSQITSLRNAERSPTIQVGPGGAGGGLGLSLGSGIMLIAAVYLGGKFLKAW